MKGEYMSERHVGKVIQVMGPVLDIRFQEGQLPELLNAIEIENQGSRVIAEVAQQIGDDVVRCIAMNSTDGMVRGVDAVYTGAPISVPVGDACLGRVFNLLGDPVDKSRHQKMQSAGAFTDRHRPMRSRCLRPRFLRQVLRLLT